jgi:hypothetical protein
MSMHIFDELYCEDDWQIMKKAHLKACQILDQPADSYRHSERLAKSVMKLFDDGERDFEVIAAAAAYSEHRKNTYH